MYVLPGLIDCHVHFREPGLERKATIASESQAARNGGIFAVCEMPNTIPPTNNIKDFQWKVEKANEVRDICDIRFFWGATEDKHLKELEDLFTNPKYSELKKNCSGLKIYMDNSTGNMKISTQSKEFAFNLCAKLNITLVAHCEHAHTNMEASAAIPYNCPASHSQRRPEESERKSIAEAIELAEKHKTSLHIAHLSTAGSLGIVAAAKKKGVNITCEVSPHHLMLSCDDYTTLGPLGKVNPPLRDISGREQLWQGIVEGIVDCIATDHAPHLLSEKQINNGEPPSGLPGVEVVLPLLLSVALGHWPHPTDVRPKASVGFSIEHIRSLMYQNPNRIFNLNRSSVDAIKINSELYITLKNEDMKTKCGWTPYNGWIVKGSFSEIKH